VEEKNPLFVLFCALLPIDGLACPKITGMRVMHSLMLTNYVIDSQSQRYSAESHTLGLALGAGI